MEAYGWTISWNKCNYRSSVLIGVLMITVIHFNILLHI